jgi:signal transduction histidine kinase/CheY-like chemotaxis protein
MKPQPLQEGPAEGTATAFEAEETVLKLTRHMSVKIGLDCLRAMVTHLAEALQADHVFVGEFTPGAVPRFTILAAFVEDEVANLIFELTGSVCSRIAATGKPVLCRKNACGRFPSDPVLSRCQAAACIAIPLKNLAERPIGAIVAAYRAPVASLSGAKSVLEILAHRAAAELLHKQEKDRLLKSEERYHTFIAQNHDAMWCLEFDRPIPTDLPAQEQQDLTYRHGYCSECNDAAARLLGLDQSGQVVGRRVVDLLQPPTPVSAGILDLIRAGYRFTASETSGVGPDGKIHFALGSHLGIVKNGELQRIWGVTHDITEFKQVQQNLWQAQKVESLGKLAGGVAHDFNNLLTVINGYAAQLLNKRSPADPDYVPLSEIHKAAEEGARITQQLLTFSRRRTFTPELLNLNTTVERDSTMLGWTLGERISLVTNLDPSLGMVCADPVEISQIMMNLAVNARDAMPGGGKLTIASSNVSLRAEQGSAPEVHDGEYVQLAITDTGTGMTKEVLDHLFEPFFTTKEPGKGTGLGLSIVCGIVHDRGGYIKVESKPGHGTTFRVLLPRAQPEPTAAPVHEDRRTKARGGEETILLVDDRQDVRTLAASLLRGLGYKVLEASGPSQALKIAGGESRIDLMLTDLFLPEMQGTELAERVRSSHAEMQIAFMSGCPDPKLKSPFLQKPFTPESLAQIVRELLDQRQSVA